MSKLTRDGLIIQRDAKPDRIVPIQECILWLHEQIEVSEGTTVQTLVDILKGNVTFFSIAFGCYFLKDMLEEQMPKEREHIQDIRAISFFHHADKNDKMKDFYFYPCVSGLGKWPKETKEQFGDVPVYECAYGLSFLSIPEIVHIPIEIDEMVMMDDQGKESKRIQLGKMEFTLFNMLLAFIEEMGDEGPPEDRKEMLSELNEALKQIDKTKG